MWIETVQITLHSSSRLISIGGFLKCTVHAVINSTIQCTQFLFYHLPPRDVCNIVSWTDGQLRADQNIYFITVVHDILYYVPPSDYETVL